MVSRWFKFGSGEFLVRGLNPYEILEIDEQIKSGELTEEKALGELFKSAIVGFRGIGGGLLISRRKKISALCADPEVRSFVLQKAMEILEGETAEREKILKILDKVEFGLRWSKYFKKGGTKWIKPSELN